MRVPGDFPEVAIRVGEVAGVAAIKGVLRFFEDVCPGFSGLFHEIVDGLLAGDVVGEGEFGGAAGLQGDVGVPGDIFSGPKAELEAGLKIEEGDSAVFVFGADDALGGPAKAVAVELQGGFEIVHAEGDEGDSWFHEGRVAVGGRGVEIF